MNVLVKRPVHKAAPEPSRAASAFVADPFDEIMIDPVTKWKITRRQWEAMGTGSKPAEVSFPIVRTQTIS